MTTKNSIKADLKIGVEMLKTARHLIADSLSSLATGEAEKDDELIHINENIIFGENKDADKLIGALENLGYFKRDDIEEGPEIPSPTILADHDIIAVNLPINQGSLRCSTQFSDNMTPVTSIDFVDENGTRPLAVVEQKQGSLVEDPGNKDNLTLYTYEDMNSEEYSHIAILPITDVKRSIKEL